MAIQSNFSFLTKVNQSVMFEVLFWVQMTFLRTTLRFLLVVLLGLTVSSAAQAEVGEEGKNRIAWAKLPDVCKQAVKAYSDDLELLYIENGSKFGIPIFEVKAMIKGTLTSLEMTADGRFIKVDEYGVVDQLPPPVLKELVEAEQANKVGVRAKVTVQYIYTIEFEDGRLPLVLDATGTPILKNRNPNIK